MNFFKKGEFFLLNRIYDKIFIIKRVQFDKEIDKIWIRIRDQ